MRRIRLLVELPIPTKGIIAIYVRTFEKTKFVFIGAEPVVSGQTSGGNSRRTGFNPHFTADGCYYVDPSLEGVYAPGRSEPDLVGSG